jgi:two-component system, sporulation sensor kinase A
VQVANRALSQLLGTPVAGLIGHSWREICDEMTPHFPAAWVLDEGLPLQGERRRARFERADTRVMMLAVQVHIVAGAAGRPSSRVVTVADVTERTQLEAQIIAQERLAAKGRLAAVIAHEVNTPLQSIETCLYMAHTATKSNQHTYLEIARQEVQRVGTLMGQLLGLYRQAVREVQWVDLNELVRRLLILVQVQCQRQRITVTTDLYASLPHMQGRADELSQVILNLLMNAVQAMPEGGRLHLATGATPTRPTASSQLRNAPLYLMLTVADEGPGIPPELHGRIFEPFFTTKPDGSGLGLAISQKIVAQFDGAITLTSKPGGGSSFQVWFPLGG